MAASSRINSLFSPLRLWLLFNILIFSAAFQSIYSLNQIVKEETKQLVEMQLFVMLKSGKKHLELGHFREFVQSIGSQYKDIYLKITDQNRSPFEFGKRSINSACATSPFHYLSNKQVSSQKIELCRFYSLPIQKIISLLMVFLLFSICAAVILYKFERKAIISLLSEVSKLGIGIKKPNSLIQLFSELSNLGDKLKQVTKKEIKLAKEQERIDIIDGLVHDLNPPVETLKVVSPRVADLNDTPAFLFRKALGRLESLSNRMRSTLNGKKIHNPYSSNSSFTLANALKEIILEQSYNLGTKKLELKIEDGLSHFLLKFDQVDFDRVVVNLISNALKAVNDEGAVKVILCRPEKDLKILIIDDGHGIEEENLSKIFEKGHTTSDDEGTGNGLAVVSKIVHSWGGKIEVESEINKGSCFSIILPSEETKKNFDLAIIDNDQLVGVTWLYGARKKGLSLLACHNIDEFLKYDLPKSIPVYCDWHVTDTRTAKDDIIHLLNLGYTNIVIVSGNPESIEKIPGTKIDKKVFPSNIYS